MVGNSLQHKRRSGEGELESTRTGGPVPSNFQSLKSLKILIISSCNLTGTIPKEIGKFGELTFIDLSDNSLSGVNNLEGKLPTETGNCTNLFTLGLAETNISGSLPSSIGMLKRIQILAIYTAQLSGHVPEEIGNCSKLQSLFLYQNLMSGPILTADINGCCPESSNWQHTKKLSKTCEASISRLTRKGEVGLDSLVGAIPGLSLCNNSLEGAILDDLGSCTELTYLDISINLLTGSIPRIDGDGDLDL
ncbi:hypothetical protein Patl1_03768 [Pistacia atlantica]|uniref:Uncharacterized protein n=1 Tax=Pistacia atlantica TaxID=434234 RepID=A0ACC1BSY5_9ROSI|nr:hypothetical protein Patl1_03768 [Pistacia atlantica]